jgi:hypothetical protein
MPSSRAATTAGTLRGCRCAARAAVAPPAASRTLAACARGLADHAGRVPQGRSRRRCPLVAAALLGADAFGDVYMYMTHRLYLSRGLSRSPSSCS